MTLVIHLFNQGARTGASVERARSTFLGWSLPPSTWPATEQRRVLNASAGFLARSAQTWPKFLYSEPASRDH